MGLEVLNQDSDKLIYIDDSGTFVSPEKKVESNEKGAKHSREKHVHTKVRHLDIVFVITSHSPCLTLSTHFSELLANNVWLIQDFTCEGGETQQYGYSESTLPVAVRKS